jgi:predicted branched-subunit amino acid permease
METQPRESALATFLHGARDTLPLLPGGVPFGLIYGVAARSAHIPAWLAQAMSAVVFAGSAQFAVAQLVAVGAPALVLALTGAILNLRHLLYSASLAPELRPIRPRWKALLAYLLTDEMYGVVSTRLRRGLAGERVRWYALGSGLTLWTEWQLSTLAGLLAGGRIPAGWSLDFAATLTFIALVTPLLTDRPSLFAAAVAVVVAALTLHAPLKLGLVAAILAGVAAGLLAERMRGVSSPPDPLSPQGEGEPNPEIATLAPLPLAGGRGGGDEDIPAVQA